MTSRSEDCKEGEGSCPLLYGATIGLALRSREKLELLSENAQKTLACEEEIRRLQGLVVQLWTHASKYMMEKDHE